MSEPQQIEEGSEEPVLALTLLVLKENVRLIGLVVNSDIVPWWREGQREISSQNRE